MSKSDFEIIRWLSDKQLSIQSGATYTDLKIFMGVTSNQTVADRIKRLAEEGHVTISKGKAGIRATYRPKKWVLASCGHLVESEL